MTATSSWRRSAGYIWAMVGSAVGFANLLSFSAHCYRGGGGAFLLPYFAAMFIVGIPMLLLESVVGQYFRSPLVEACVRAKGQRASFWGWLSVISCLTIGAFYAVLTGYSLVYFSHALVGGIPEDTATFFRSDILHLTSGLNEMGPLVLPLILSTLAVMILTYFVNRKPISRGIEVACSYFMPVLGLLAFVGAVTVLFLPGAVEGVARLFIPKIESLANPSLWRDVFGQLFFSYSLGLGIVVGYSAHAGSHIKLRRAIVLVALGDFAISLLSAIVIFGCVGAVSYAQGVSFESWLLSDSTFEIGFVVYPKLLKSFGPIASYCLQLVLFFCLFIAGITGVFSIVESVAGNLQWRFNWNREQTTRWSCLVMLAGAFWFCHGFGAHLIDALAPQVLGVNMLLGALALIFIFVAKKSTLEKHELFAGGRLRQFLLCMVMPWALVSLTLSLYSEIKAPFDLGFMIRLGWVAAACLIAISLSKKVSFKKTSAS